MRLAVAVAVAAFLLLLEGEMALFWPHYSPAVMSLPLLGVAVIGVGIVVYELMQPESA